MFYESKNSPATGSPQTAGLIPVSLANQFGRRHVQCANGLEIMHRAEHYPRDLSLLPETLASYLGSRPTPSLDLSDLGYEFHAAGECIVPGKQSIHLVYRSVEEGRFDSVSLWMKRYRGHPVIDPGKVYSGGPNETAHPLLIWRDKSMIYYLVGDSEEHLHEVANQLMRG